MKMDKEHPIDLEQSDKTKVRYEVTADADAGSVNEEIARARAIQSSFRPLRALRQTEKWLDSKMGIETQGIDRIPEEQKRPPSIINAFFFWWSAMLHAGAVPVGILGPAFGLSLNQCIAGAIAGNFLGSLCVAYTGTLGPKVSLLRRLQWEDILT